MGVKSDLVVRKAKKNSAYVESIDARERDTLNIRKPQDQLNCLLTVR